MACGVDDLESVSWNSRVEPGGEGETTISRQEGPSTCRDLVAEEVSLCSPVGVWIVSWELEEAID